MSDTKRFAGKTALVTGAAGNIGLAVARRLAREGSHVILLDLDQAKLDDAAKGFAEHGVKVKTVVCDVTNYKSVEDAVEYAEKTVGPIDFLFNNAGYQGPLPQSMNTRRKISSVWWISISSARFTYYAPYRVAWSTVAQAVSSTPPAWPDYRARPIWVPMAHQNSAWSALPR